MLNINRNVRRVSQDLEALRNERQHVQEEHNTLKGEVQKAEEEIGKLVRLQGTLEAKKLELSHAKQELSGIASVDSKDLRSTQQRAQTEHDTLAREVQQAEDEVGKLVRLKRELATKKSALARAAQNISRVRRQTMRLNRDLSVLERQLRDMRARR